MSRCLMMPNILPHLATPLVRVHAVAVAILLTPAIVQAQTCLGLPSLDVAKANIKGVYLNGDGISAIGGGAVFRAGARSFVDLEYSRTEADDVDFGSHVIEGQVGLQLAPKRPDAWRLCPTFGITTEFLDDIEFLGETLEASAWAAVVGVGFGRTVGDPTGVTFTPFATTRLVYSRTTASFGGFSGRETTEFALVQGGLGILFTPTVALRPWFIVPIGRGEPDTRFGLTLAVGVPGAR